MTQAAAQAGYKPRSATNPLKEIVEDHLEEFVQVYDERYRATYGPMHPRLRDLFERFLRCGDPHFGFMRLVCEDCGENKFVPVSTDVPSPEYRLERLENRPCRRELSDGSAYQGELFSPYSPLPRSQKGIDSFLDRHFASSKAEVNLAQLEPSVLESVEGGVAKVGMSKEQVFMALGFPTKIDNNVDAGMLTKEEVLQSNQWIYRFEEVLWFPIWRVYQFDLKGNLVRTIE